MAEKVWRANPDSDRELRVQRKKLLREAKFFNFRVAEVVGSWQEQELWQLVGENHLDTEYTKKHKVFRFEGVLVEKK